MNQNRHKIANRPPQNRRNFMNKNRRKITNQSAQNRRKITNLPVFTPTMRMDIESPTHLILDSDRNTAVC